MTFRTVLTMTAIFVLFPARALRADSLYGTATAHNGSLTSHPAGTGDVQVDFSFPTDVAGPYQAFYYEVATHEIDFTYDPGPSDFLYSRSFFYNQSGIDWTGIVIRLEGADFAGWDIPNPPQARTIDPVVQTQDATALIPEDIQLRSMFPRLHPFSLDSSAISRFNDTGSGFTDAELTILFDDPVRHGWEFILDYSVIHSLGLPDATSFTMYVTPIPEPASALLLALTAVAISPHPRRLRP